MDEKGRWLIEEPDFSSIFLNPNYEVSSMPHLISICSMNRTNNNELNNIYLLKNIFHFRLHDDVIIEKNFEIKKYIFAVRIFDGKAFFESYNTNSAILYIINQRNNFKINFVICFIVGMLRVGAKFFYVGWAKFLTMTMINIISQKLFNAYSQYKINIGTEKINYGRIF